MKPIDHNFPWSNFRNQDDTIDLIKAFDYISGGYRSLFLEGFDYPIKSRQVAAWILFQVSKNYSE